MNVEIRWIPADAAESPDDWPVQVDVEYEEDGPGLMCAGWVLGPRSFPSPCRSTFTGMTLAEFRDSVTQHISTTQHVESPFKVLNDMVAAKCTKEKETSE